MELEDLESVMILVTGATGTIGRPLVELLAAQGVRVRAVTRSPDKAALPPGVDVVAGDPARPDTLAGALDGVSAAFLHPRAVGDAAADFAELASEHGVRRLVALSAINIDDPLSAQPSRYRGDRNKEAEEAVIASGLEWVSLRASSFAVNVLQSGWDTQIRAGDVVRGPYADFAESPLHERDLAAAAAHAFLTDDLLGQRQELTGPRSLTHTDMVRIIGDVLGRPLHYEEVPAAVVRQGMLGRGFPEAFVDALLTRYANGVGQPAPVTDQLEKILGQTRTFADWAADHTAAFRN
ncbi:SDR family oxidoreductase [Nocardia sp. CA-129566]|uniref:SDR family oxidoreductase n=1 Tax=Nocardia sp. CA-129566 TaxID=3239976 RepID=UPI003D973A83